MMNEITIRDTLYLPEFEECLRRNGYSFNVDPVFNKDDENVGARVSIIRKETPLQRAIRENEINF